MRRLTSLAVLVILIAAVPAFALDENRDNRDARTANYERDRHTVIDDVVKMSQAGVSDESIIRFINQSRDRYVVDADTIIALNDAHVSKAVINALMDGAYDRGDRRDGDRVVQERVYVRPYPYYYGGYYDPYWYDPFWYGPRVSIGFGFGFGGYRGGYHGGYHGGGHRGHR